MSSPVANNDPWLQQEVVETTSSAGESFVSSSNIRDTEVHLQPQWFDNAPQPG